MGPFLKKNFRNKAFDKYKTNRTNLTIRKKMMGKLWKIVMSGNHTLLNFVLHT